MALATAIKSPQPCPSFSACQTPANAKDAGILLVLCQADHESSPLLDEGAIAQPVGHSPPHPVDLDVTVGGNNIDRDTLDTIPAVGFGIDGDVVATRDKQGLGNSEYTLQEHEITKESEEVPCCDSPPSTKPSTPFHKWMRTLQKRAVRQREDVLRGWDRSLIPHHLDADGAGSSMWSDSGRQCHHRQSSSESSFRFVTTVKSASISLTSASVFSRSRRNTIRSSRGHSRTDRSSRASFSAARVSEDSFYHERQTLMDPAATERSLQRRRILEEMISTEESYIGDVRFLMNVYVTMLASLPTLPASLRSSINRNLTDIVELHEEMLGDLHRIVPHSEYTQLDLPLPPTPGGVGVRGHTRWRSLDAVPEDKDGISWLRDTPGMLADPQTAAEVAKVFSRKMNRFFVYEEYGAKYELMIKDVASAHRTMPRWQSYQKGLEVLAASVGSANSQDDRSKKSLTIGDLLVKPIQRVCKYPLLFAELLKYTPVADCPYSHMEIENTLIRLREATAEINRATDDTRVKSVLEKTWILQDRLVFPNQQLDAASKNRVRSFGHIQLCGALHVCWQTKEGVNGQYMVALLYREWLCLATASRTDQIYTIQACIALSNIKVEEVDNGRGLQCHTAPYSWKLVFISDHQLYEVILTACTPKEEIEWRTRLSTHQASENQEQAQPAIFSLLSLNIKTLGTVFRKPGTIARRISIHRATTVGPKSPLCQVILKNTSVMKDTPNSSGPAVATTGGSQINRSQSLLTTNNRIPVLAPARGERARLEALLSDVWTRDILPFPGITARSRSEHLVRASASSVMRKLSVVSITSSFTKRSASLASVQARGHNGTLDEGYSSTPASSISGPPTPTGLTMMTYASPAPNAVKNHQNSKSDDVFPTKSLLSVIPDEVERCSPTLSCSEKELVATATCTVKDPVTVPTTDYWGVDVLRVVRRLDRVWVRSGASSPTSNSQRSQSPETTECGEDLVQQHAMEEKLLALSVPQRNGNSSPLSRPCTPASIRAAARALRWGSNGTIGDNCSTVGSRRASVQLDGRVGLDGSRDGKENIFFLKHGQDIGEPGQDEKGTGGYHSSRLSNRWAKVGAHREVVVQSIRNLFR